MLNLQVAMVNQLMLKPIVILVLTLLSGLLITPGLYITSPENGAVVEGVVEIRGSVPEENFSSAELLYAYAQSEIETWFLIKRIDNVIQDDVLAAWDTTTITDGVYRLKLVMRAQDGSENAVFVENIQVSNYSRAEGSTDGEQPKQTTTPLAVINNQYVTPSINATAGNPASIYINEVRQIVVVGVFLAFISLGMLALYTSIQHRRRRR